MKTAVLLLLATSTMASTKAQWTTDLASNTAVRAVTVGEAAVPLITDGPEGSTYVCWFENGNGDYQLRMQRLDAGGNKWWADEGLLISDHPQNSALFRYDLKTDADGNAVVAFQDERTGNLDVVAYKIAPDGTFIWGPDGVELPSPGTTGLAPSLATLSNGNTAISWNMDSTPRSVGVQLVDPDGALLLANPIVVSAAVNLTNFRPVATSDGGFDLFYGVSAGGFGLPPWVLNAQRYDATGTPVWANPVQVSSKSIAFFHYPNAVSDGHDGFYVAFNTSNPDNASLSDVYLQRVRGNGTLWSPEGTRLDNSSSTQKFTGGRGVALVNDNSGMLVALQVTDMNQDQSGISVQRVDTAGLRQLGDQASTVLAVGAQAVQPWDISATTDGALILHATTAGFDQTTLATTRVTLDGTPVWTPAQQDICTLSSGKDDMQLSGMQNGQVVAVWQDSRTPAGIYAQNITGLDIGTTVVDRAAAGGGIRLESNPAESPVLLLPAAATALSLAVYDQQGRRAYVKEMAANTGRLVLPLGDLPSGAYAIRCMHGDQTTVLRWVK